MGHDSGESERLGPWSPEPYRSPWWLSGPHMQTLGGRVLRGHPSLPLQTHRFDTPDGDFLEVEAGSDPGPHSPIVLLLHGLEGSARRGYALRSYEALRSRGIFPLGLHFRGCGSTMNRRARFYHSGETEDLETALTFVQDRWPGRPLGALGFSLGGNVLLKFLGEQGARGTTPLGAAVGISVPFDLEAGARYLEGTRMGRAIYTTYFLRSLKRKVRAKRKLLESLIDVDATLHARSIREFDEAATAPLHGFGGAQDYYRRSSSQAFLDSISVPTLALHAIDDPFLPGEFLPHAALHANPNIELTLTPRGGHVGFIEGLLPWRPYLWAENTAANFLSRKLTPG